ncbi:MAG: helix-turn-helix domain-containing protein [Desulfatibacillaceae bacterium]|nr:helix-turn-helix domain-containing protein [Desulfatibacillaceae bacterium]
MNGELLSTKEAAQFLTARPNTLEIWRIQGQGPRFVKIGRLVRYKRSDLLAFIEAGSRQSTSEAAHVN